MADDVYQLQIKGQAGGQFVENVLYFQGAKSNSVTPEADANALVNAFISGVMPSYLGCMPTDYSSGGFRAKRVNNTGGPSQVVVYSQPGTGAAQTFSQAQGACCIGDYYAAGATKPQWRATRIFLPAAWVGAITEGQIQNAYGVAVNAFITAVQGALGSGPAGPFQYVAWSRTDNQAYPVVNMEMSLLVGTQRRRLRPVV